MGRQAEADEAAKASARRVAATAAGFRGDAERARAMLADSSPAVRRAAFSALVRLEAVSPGDTAAALADPSPAVRVAACELSAKLEGTDFTSLLNDPDSSVVEAAAFAVGEQGDRSGTRRLCQIASGHDDPLCRESAVAALGALGDPQARRTILACLEDVPAVRRRAVVALAAFEGPDVEAALRERLSDHDWQVRQAAADVLGLSEPEPR